MSWLPARSSTPSVKKMLRYHKHTHLLFSLESLANLARNGRVKPVVSSGADDASGSSNLKPVRPVKLDVICKTRPALAHWIAVLELKEHGYTNGKVNISHCGNPAAESTWH